MYQRSLSKLTPQEYIRERIDNEIAERKVYIKKNQKWFYALRITMIISTALIPVIIAIDAESLLLWLFVQLWPL